MSAGDRVRRFAERLAPRIPEPLVVAVSLVVLAFVLGLAIDRDGLGAGAMCERFFKGMFEPSLLAFALQIALVLVAGSTLAAAPPIRRALLALGEKPRSERGAAALVATAAMALAAVNWGLALIGGAVLARAVLDAFETRGQRVSGGLVGTAGYMGLAVWHGGLSGSAPLAAAGPPDPRQPLTEVPLTETVLSAQNLVLWAALFVIVPAVFWRLGSAETVAAGAVARRAVPAPRLRGGVSGSFLALMLATPIAVGAAWALAGAGTSAINLPFVIAATLVLGLLLHGSLDSFRIAFEEGAAGAGSILLQFPIYFGILAIARDSGLFEETLSAFLAATDAVGGLLPRDKAAALATYVAASAVNFFVPSGGAQWALQGPIVAETARAVGCPAGPLVMAMAYGDQCTNLLQPFWALPLLSITRLKVGDLFAWCATLCGILFVLFGVWVCV
jgi:short-chain fatty acids transporter